MADVVITNAADKLVSPAAWAKQTDITIVIAAHTQAKAAYEVSLVPVKANVREVLAPIIVRAGGTIAAEQEITNVVVNSDGSVTITYA